MLALDGHTGRSTGPEISKQDIGAIIHELATQRQAGRKFSQTDYIVTMRKLAEAGAIHTLEAILPLALSLNGRPYHLRDHFPFSPIFHTKMAQRTLLKTGRQLSKSTSLASHGVMLSVCVPNFKTLYVTPLYEQIRRFSNNYVRPLIDNSPIRSMWLGTSTEKSVLQRSFANGSLMQFSFALLDADRIRGVAADKVAIDEIQDMDPAHLPIIRETLSASDWSITQMTGTPKSKDNPIEGLWKRSSMAEWFIPCYACGEWNIPSMDYHVEKMIGPLHEHISENCPAIVCHKCQKPINPRPPHGRWIHRYEERRWSLAGYHVPQIILPLHYARRDKWAELVSKRETTAPSVFYNEVLGESVDVGQKLVTETELRAASKLGWKNNERQPVAEIFSRLKHYRMVVMAVDWGGGGEDMVSFTSLALMGLTPAGRIDVLWGKRLKTPNDHMREAKEVIHWIRRFGCELLAHDFTGAGTLRETVLVQSGFEIERVMPIQLVRMGSLIRQVPPSVLNQRLHYRVDKPRTLLYTCQAIKLQLCLFFEYDFVDDDQPGLIADFLALVEEKTPSRYAGDLYSITKNTTLSDDFAQAVNLGCIALWHANEAWPDFAAVARIARLTPAQITAAGHADYGWDEDRTMAGYLHQP